MQPDVIRRLRATLTVAARGMVLAALLVCPAMADGSWEGKKLPDLPTEFIVGYGSLINTASRNSTAGMAVAAIPVRVKAALGYIRGWNERGLTSHWTTLGLRKPKAGESASPINGVLYPVDAAELTKYDRRERGYARVAVPAADIEAVGWQRLPESGHFWIYVPRAVAQAGGDGPPSAPEFDYPILQSYIDVVVEGGLEYGPEFAREIVETTDGWSRFWLNDRDTPHRPWVHDPAAAKVDQLLAAASTTAALLPLRAFPETYGDIRRENPAGK